MTVLFYIAGFVAVFSTVMVITRLNAIHALLYLIVSLLSVAVVFFTLGAPFVAALEVIIYAGAIMVLFIFVVMMLNVGPDAARHEQLWLNPKMFIGPAVLAAILAVEFVYILSMGDGAAAGQQQVAPKEVGISMFSEYLLGVELAGMMLLAGLVGAYHLGRRMEKQGSSSDAQEKSGVDSKATAGRG